MVSPISNSKSTIFFTNIYDDSFFYWQTEKKTVLDEYIPKGAFIYDVRFLNR